jgi:hypothetical protein
MVVMGTEYLAVTIVSVGYEMNSRLWGSLDYQGHQVRTDSREVQK